MPRRFLFSTIFLFASFLTFGQKQDLDKYQGCQRRWKYKNLEKGFSGTIVFFEQPVVMCGVASTASVALVKTDNGETLRVLTMCNIKKDFNTPPGFKVGEKVKITPDEKPAFRVDIIPVDFLSCRLRTAYFGIIQKVD